MTTIDQIQAALRQFADDRDWQRFHSPKNLVMALSAEVGALTEFQWLTEEESQQSTREGETRRRVEDELADVTLYLLRLADILEVDLLGAAKAKSSAMGLATRSSGTGGVLSNTTPDSADWTRRPIAAPCNDD